MDSFWNISKLLFKTSRPISWVFVAFFYVCGIMLSNIPFSFEVLFIGFFLTIPYSLLLYGINVCYKYNLISGLGPV